MTIRNPAHVGDEAAGGEPLLCDLERAGEDELARVTAGADASSSRRAVKLIACGPRARPPTRRAARERPRPHDHPPRPADRRSRDGTVRDRALAGVTFEAVAGETPIEEALAAL